MPVCQTVRMLAVQPNSLFQRLLHVCCGKTSSQPGHMLDASEDALSKAPAMLAQEWLLQARYKLERQPRETLPDSVYRGDAQASTIAIDVIAASRPVQFSHGVWRESVKIARQTALYAWYHGQSFTSQDYAISITGMYTSMGGGINVPPWSNICWHNHCPHSRHVGGTSVVSRPYPTSSPSDREGAE